MTRLSVVGCARTLVGVMRKTIVAALALLLLSCDPLARTELRLTFDETGEKVAVAILADKERVNAIREVSGEGFGEDILRSRDEWSLRLANANAGNERIIFDRSGRELTRVEQQATIDGRDLQKLFYDVGVTVQMTRGDGWSELTLYPGTSTRATRQQRTNVANKLREFADQVARYYQSIGAMYKYVDANSNRAEDLFAALFAEKDDEVVPLSDDERDLVKNVRAALEPLFTAEAGAFNREADLVYNPFPGRIDVVVPGQTLIVEGFAKAQNGELVASTITPTDALPSLEGRWISPEPLAAGGDGEKVTARELAVRIAGKPRSVKAVIDGADIMRAVIEAIQPAPRYRVRFVTTAPKPSS